MKKLLQFEYGGCVIALAALTLTVAAWSYGAPLPLLNRALHDVRNDGPNDAALGEQTRNYYEVLLKSGARRNLPAEPPKGFWRWLRGPRNMAEGWISLHRSGAMRGSDRFVVNELIPDKETLNKGVVIRANRWGYRGPDWTREKPPGVIRIAFAGGSNVMGSGVAYEQGFVHQLQERLNRERPAGADIRYETLNFAIDGYFLPHNCYVIREEMLPFQPDLIVLVSTMHDRQHPVPLNLARMVANGQDLYFDCLKQLAARFDMRPTDSIGRLRRGWASVVDEMVQGLFDDLAEFSPDAKVPVAVFVLRLDPRSLHPSLPWIAGQAEQRGLPALRGFDAYESRQPHEVYLNAADFHPTTKAHEWIADELFDKMMANPIIHELLTPQTNEVTYGGQ